MSARQSLRSAYKEISEYREGARYCKMDLHTHSPASECSSFTLPPEIEAVFPHDVDGKTKKITLEQKIEFLKKFTSRSNPFKKPYGRAALKSFPRLGKRPALNVVGLNKIADAWLDEIETIHPLDKEGATKEEKKRIKESVTRAIVDIERYMASRFFPEEYVLRCLLEGMQLVALTDHNHPGYIVPRLPELGTWYDSIQAVNEVYTSAIHKGDPKGKVRETILARLKLARKRIDDGFDEISKVSSEDKKNHKDRAKKLKAIEKRRDHIIERTEYWKDEENTVQPLTLLPGVEITASNVHLLAVFPPQWYASVRMAGVLRLIGIPENHWGRGFVAAASSSVQDTITHVKQEGGLVIPAHSNSDFKGLLRLFRKGIALNKVIEHPALLALESIGGTIKVGDKKKDSKNACETLKWLERGSNRPDRSKPLCFVKGSDAHEVRIELDGTGEDMGKRFTYVKLDIRKNDTADEIFRSLRLALLSGQSRVIEFPVEKGYNYAASGKKKEDYTIKKSTREDLLDCELHRSTIIGITASGDKSYSDGLKVRFNPFLNCIIGSGGKSVLVRMVGYAFGIQGFLEESKNKWLPEQVRVFWRMGDSVFCVERSGRHHDPDEVEARNYKLIEDGKWEEIGTDMPDPQVRLWPSREEQDDISKLSNFEDDVIEELEKFLKTTSVVNATPLLINQPWDIFDNHALFQKILSKPLIKSRQIIWSTGSSNVPTALDAEKIIVTAEDKKGKHMEIVCGGDLHEDEIRSKLLDEFEGGDLAFARRMLLYSK